MVLKKIDGIITNTRLCFVFQSKKPLMEKMRRARINDSLNELKTLVLEAMKKDVSLSKFEQFKEVKERLECICVACRILQR